MYLVYMGESGNTGNSANDPNQLHHVHVGLLMHENQCISVNGEFNALWRRHFGVPPGEPGGPRELRPADLYQGRGFFNSWQASKRGELIQDCLDILIRRQTPGIIAYIDKQEFAKSQASPDSPYAIWGEPSAYAADRFLFALNMLIDEINMQAMDQSLLEESIWPIKDYTLVVAGQGTSVKPGLMNQFLQSESEIPTPAVLENFCYVAAEHSVCTQLANLCAYFARRWLQNPDLSHAYFETLQEGGVIQVIYPVQFY